MLAQIAIVPMQKKPYLSCCFDGDSEGLDNYDETITFLQRLRHDGINMSLRSITLSTCGLVPEIKRLAHERFACHISNFSSFIKSRYRNKLIIANITQFLVISAIIISVTGRRVTYEYTLFKDVNDHPQG